MASSIEGQPLKVFINVYDILRPDYNGRIATIGMGIYHTGIEV